MTGSDDARTDARTVPPAELGYGEASDELDTIIAELDQGVVDIDVLEQRLKRAVDIIEELDRRIRGVRERVGAILPRLESVGRSDAADAAGGHRAVPAEELEEPF